MKSLSLLSFCIFLFSILTAAALLICCNDIVHNPTDPSYDTVTTQPSITPGAGPPYSTFTVTNSGQILFSFVRDSTAGNTIIGMTLPEPGCTFDFTKESDPSCGIGDGCFCTGSLITVPPGISGPIMIMNEGEGTNPASFIVKIESGSPGTWTVIPAAINASINYIRTIPTISITYPAEVLSGYPYLVTLDASATVPTFEPPTLMPAPTITSYSWSSTVALSSTTSSAPTFSVPSVTVDTDLTFTLTVTDDAGLTATATIIVTVLAR